MAQIKLFRGQNTSFTNKTIEDGAIYIIAKENNTGEVYADVGQQRIKIGSGLPDVQIKSTQEWIDETPKTVSQKGMIYVFWEEDSEGVFTDSPRIKIGDGNAYVIDLPFVDGDKITITQDQIDHWNHKLDIVSEEIENENLIFTRSMDFNFNAIDEETIEESEE